jgi:hypothetical protein
MFTSIVRVRLLRTQLDVCLSVSIGLSCLLESTFESAVVILVLALLYRVIRVSDIPVDVTSSQYVVARMSDSELISASTPDLPECSIPIRDAA